MIPLSEPTSKYDEDYHRHDFHSEDGTHLATIEFDDITDERGGIWCELTIWLRTATAPAEPVIGFERINLLTKTSIKGILGRLDTIGSMNWSQGIDTAIFRTITTYRSSGSELSWMEDRPITADDNPYLLEPFIAREGVSLLFAPKGTGKSTFALQLAWAVASGEGFGGYKPLRTGTVMYLDFEDVVRPHELRLAAMADDFGNKIRHFRITRSLKDSRRLIKRLVRDEGIVMVVLDSVALARASDVSGSEATIKMFKTLAQLGVPVLAIDHMTKENNKAVATGKMDVREASPIGSQFTESSARLGWFMIELPQSTKLKKVFNLYNSKNNHAPKNEHLGLTMEIVPGEFHSMKSITYTLSGQPFEVIVADIMKMTKAQRLLLWHFKQQREEGGVIPMTLKAMNKSGINGSTLRGIVTSKNTEWWEQIRGSKQYTLTPDGLEAAIFVDSMFGGANEGANNGQEQRGKGE